MIKRQFLVYHFCDIVIFDAYCQLLRVYIFLEVFSSFQSVYAIMMMMMITLKNLISENILATYCNFYCSKFLPEPVYFTCLKYLLDSSSASSYSLKQNTLKMFVRLVGFVCLFVCSQFNWLRMKTLLAQTSSTILRY